MMPFKRKKTQVADQSFQQPQDEPLSPEPLPGDTGGGTQQEPTIITPKKSTHVVKQGDTLSSISILMYGSSNPLYIDAIFEANSEAMPNKNSLRLGQQLTIPKFPRP